MTHHVFWKGRGIPKDPPVETLEDHETAQHMTTSFTTLKAFFFIVSRDTSQQIGYISKWKKRKKYMTAALRI